METIIKQFNECTNREIYDIFKTRVDVFVVEQNCPYPEIDEYDLISIHLFLKEKDQIVSYCRIIPPHTKFEQVSIGRVLSLVRRKGYASLLLNKALEVIEKEYGKVSVVLEAQVYASKLYENCGFEKCSEIFLEDGIPHIRMIKNYKY